MCHDFDWSFKPVTRLVHLITGVPLMAIDTGSDQQPRWKLLTNVSLGFVLLVLNISSHLLMLYFDQRSLLGGWRTHAISLSVTIEILIYALYTSASHLGFWLVTWTGFLSGNNLMNALQHVENTFHLRADHFRQFRKITVIGLAYILLVNHSSVAYIQFIHSFIDWHRNLVCKLLLLSNFSPRIGPCTSRLSASFPSAGRFVPSVW